MKFAEAVRSNLLAVADAYRAATGLSEATVSGRFHGKNDFLGQFRRGKVGIGVDKVGDMLRAFAKAWPEEARWPDLVVVPMWRPRP